MVLNFIIPLLITIALNILAYVLTPQPKRAQPPEVAQLELPTLGEGATVIKVHGTARIRQVNVLGYAGKVVRTYKVSA